MTEEQIIKVTHFARRIIMEEGYMSGMNLAMKIAGFVYDKEIRSKAIKIPLEEIFKRIIERPGLNSIEYTKKDTEDYRVKDLFYYNVKEEALNKEI